MKGDDVAMSSCQPDENAISSGASSICIVITLGCESEASFDNRIDLVREVVELLLRAVVDLESL